MSEEDLALAGCNAAVAAEGRLKEATGGWLGLGGGLTGGGGVLALALQYRKKLLAVIAGKDRAIDGMDDMLERGIPNEKRRRQLGAGNPDIAREHELRRNGSAA